MSCASELMKMGVDIEDLRKIYLAALEWQQGYDNPDYTVREVDGLHRELLDLCRKETKKLSEIAMKRWEEGR